MAPPISTKTTRKSTSSGAEVLCLPTKVTSNDSTGDIIILLASSTRRKWVSWALCKPCITSPLMEDLDQMLDRERSSGDGNSMPPLRPPTVQCVASSAGAQTIEKPMCPFPLQHIRLICPPAFASFGLQWRGSFWQQRRKLEGNTTDRDPAKGERADVLSSSGKREVTPASGEL
mmetsp:Transcript_22714/g.69418  ORF Transcript_22714/g.69418 Transcript_22714/m.69418 type:complete len:174 (-) Transcript_22714:151-672(-)